MFLLLKSAFTKKNILRFLSIVLFILVFAFLQKKYSGINPERIQALIMSYGVYGPLMFLAFSFFRPVLFFPVTIIYLSSGLAFGGFWGGVIAILGALIMFLDNIGLNHMTTINYPKYIPLIAYVVFIIISILLIINLLKNEKSRDFLN